MDGKIQDCKAVCQESRKPLNTWVDMGIVEDCNGRGSLLLLLTPPLRINLINPNKDSDLEDDDKDDNDYPRYGSCTMCGHIGIFSCPCDQWECEDTGAIRVDPPGD
jgi:hypothetical protein